MSPQSMVTKFMFHGVRTPRREAHQPPVDKNWKGKPETYVGYLVNPPVPFGVFRVFYCDGGELVITYHSSGGHAENPTTVVVQRVDTPNDVKTFGPETIDIACECGKVEDPGSESATKAFVGAIPKIFRAEVAKLICPDNWEDYIENTEE